MEWWQSLLIALIPAVITAGITLAVSLVQIKRAKMEMVAKYETDKKQHISKMRLDMEFSIYKELSEKVVSLVTNCFRLFPYDFNYSRIGKPSQSDADFELHNNIASLLNDANEAINKYAIFIPKKWYEKFEHLKLLCKEQLISFGDYVLDGKTRNKTGRAVKNECNKRDDEIENVFDELVSELREYIASLDAGLMVNE